MAALTAVGALAFAGVQTAEASCGGGGPGGPSLGDRIAAAPTVFVGTVVYTSDQERVARVKVESIWRGPELPAYIDVHGSPVSGPFTASSVDRHYQSGTRYLFVPVNANPPFDDNSCSLTQPYTADLVAYAPSDARAAGPATFSDHIQNFLGQNAWVLPLLFVLIIAGALAALIRMRGRKRRQA
ncbi:MAG: hypothetical protein AUH82_01620 [Chloroflexi bacterium 13_1_40CM_4_65_13]|nr:MAG: hypothetical protein AUH82_01620 [Chloroflexi bacterium 13_1_40CM_4_65_13]